MIRYIGAKTFIASEEEFKNLTDEKSIDGIRLVSGSKLYVCLKNGTAKYMYNKELGAWSLLESNLNDKLTKTNGTLYDFGTNATVDDSVHNSCIEYNGVVMVYLKLKTSNDTGMVAMNTNDRFVRFKGINPPDGDLPVLGLAETMTGETKLFNLTVRGSNFGGGENVVLFTPTGIVNKLKSIVVQFMYTIKED